MYRIYPDDCARLAKVGSINDLKAPDLMKIAAEREGPFASRYYNDDSDRSAKEQEDDVVNGKFGELLVMISLAKSGHKITQGVLFTEESDPKMYGDGGIDLAADYKDIQVKYCNGSYLNFRTKRQEDAVRKNLENNVKVLICHHCLNQGKRKYIIRHLTYKFFKDNLKASKQNYSISYIQCYDIPEVNVII